MIYTSFFNQFPKIKYGYETTTDIFIRIAVVHKTINNTASYYVYEVDDGDTPEILAEQVYGDAGANWMILYANYMFDPQFDWVLPYDAFNQFIISKYGSIEAAMSKVHHYEKVITRTLEPDNVSYETRFVVNETTLTQNDLAVPYDYYEGLIDPLARDQYVETFNIFGKTLTQISRGEAIDCYKYEQDLNEQKRLIKVIKSEYYLQILGELRKLTNYSEPYARRLS
jgi:hypothetical protein